MLEEWNCVIQILEGWVDHQMCCLLLEEGELGFVLGCVLGLVVDRCDRAASVLVLEAPGDAFQDLGVWAFGPAIVYD